VERKKDGKMEGFENSTIRQFDNGKNGNMDEWMNGNMEEFENSTIRQLEEWKYG